MYNLVFKLKTNNSAYDEYTSYSLHIYQQYILDNNIDNNIYLFEDYITSDYKFSSTDFETISNEIKKDLQLECVNIKTRKFRTFDIEIDFLSKDINNITKLIYDIISFYRVNYKFTKKHYEELLHTKRMEEMRYEEEQEEENNTYETTDDYY